MRLVHAIHFTLGLFCLSLGGCGDAKPDKRVFDASATAQIDPQEGQIRAEIAQLSRGKDAKDDDGQAAHDDAVSKLTARGSAVELRVVDALRTSADWNVRLGCVEVLQSIGTKTCVDHLITALLDSEPLVAFQANHTLEALTKHQEIPPPGGRTGDNGLPPVPSRPPTELAMDTELKLWTSWYNVHQHPLHDAWASWWKGNAARTKVD